jgi:hypothetical protein
MFSIFFQLRDIQVFDPGGDLQIADLVLQFLQIIKMVFRRPCRGLFVPFRKDGGVSLNQILDKPLKRPGWNESSPRRG